MMTTCFSYLFEANIVLTILVLGFVLLLKNIPQFQLNRVFLLGIMVFSLAIPFAPMPILFPKVQEQTVVALSNSPLADDAVFETPDTTEEQSPFTFPSTEEMLTWLYWLGVLAMVITCCTQVIHLLLLRNNAKKIQWKNYTLYQPQTAKANFSFFGWIFINSRWDSLPAHEQTTIIQHEAIHAQQYHSLDILCVEVMKIFFWFNPAVWLLKSALQAQHEYFVDEQLTNQGSAESYASLLLRLAKAKPPYVLPVNSISHFSILKKRIIMMTKPKSQNQLWQYALLLPVLLIALFACSTFEEELALDETQNNTLIEQITFNNAQVNLNEGVFLKVAREVETAATIAVILRKDAKIESLKYTLVLGKSKIKAENLEFKDNSFVLNTKIPQENYLFESVYPDENKSDKLKIILEAKLEDGSTEIITFPVNYEGEIVLERPLSSIVNIYFNGEIVDLRKGLDYDKIIEAGKAEFEIHTREGMETPEKVVLTMAKGRRAMFSKQLEEIAKGNIQKISVQELISRKEYITNVEVANPRLIIEVDGSIVTVPILNMEGKTLDE